MKPTIRVLTDEQLEKDNEERADYWWSQLSATEKFYFEHLWTTILKAQEARNKGEDELL